VPIEVYIALTFCQRQMMRCLDPFEGLVTGSLSSLDCFHLIHSRGVRGRYVVQDGDVIYFRHNG
jgi:hypothetical protein